MTIAQPTQKMHAIAASTIGAFGHAATGDASVDSLSTPSHDQTSPVNVASSANSVRTDGWSQR
jgi:hypothetical protein